MIELLAVIILIGVIALIVGPIVIGTIKKTKKSAFERSIDGIIDSVRIDYSEDQFLTPREYYYDKTKLTLLTVNEKTRDEEVKISGKIDGNGFIYVDGEGNIYIENICNKDYCASGPEGDIDINDNPTGEIPELNKKDPMIKLNGDSIIYVELNGTYKELGAIARTKVGDPLEYQTEIKQNNVVVSNIDTSKEGEYIVTYRTTSNNETVTVDRKVIVLEMTPVITMTEPNSNYVKEQEVLINVTGKLPNKITKFTYQINDGEIQTVNGTSKKIVLNKTGIQTVKVVVTDDHNHTSTLSKSYKIDRIPPVITFLENTTVKITEVATFDLLTGVKVEDNIDGVMDNSRVSISGSLSSTLGNQTITYTVSDNAGNIATKERTITVVEAEGPILNFSSVSSNSKWVKAQVITITATDNSNLSSFTYEVIKDGTSGGVQTVSVSGKSGSATVPLSADGQYSIKLMGRDQYGNSSTSTSGTYKIDVTKPTITMSNVTIKDNEVASYNLMTGVTVSDNSGITPTVKTTGTLGTTPKDYTITYTVTDEAGNVTIATRKITVEDVIQTPEEIMTNNPNVAALDPDGNKRYVGGSPNNYVKFNNELWRIIGVFDGQMKIIKNDFSTETIKWHTSNMTGSNNWRDASLNKQLNDTYFDTLESSSKKYIDQNHIWNMGGNHNNGSTRAEFYRAERGTDVYSINPTVWVSAIGLIYPSDYGYATSYNACDTKMNLWDSDSESQNCYSSEYNWLASSTYNQWTLTPGGSTAAFRVRKSGGIALTGVIAGTTYARPVVYLKKNIQISGGNGTDKEPYILSMEETSTEAIVMGKKVTNADGISLDDYGNPRYIGGSPKNYVKFNNELWRIIGVFDGQAKIIKNDFYSTASYWGQNPSRSDWSKSCLQTELNTTYLNSIEEGNKSYIDQNHIWNLGGIPQNDSDGNINWPRKKVYDKERGTDVYKENATTWLGAIGLMYASDYGYATSYENCTTSMWTWYSTGTGNHNCYAASFNWLVNSSYNQWTMSHIQDYSTVIFISTNGSVSNKLNDAYPDYGQNSVKPVLFLKPTVKIKSGTGNQNDPFILTN